MVSNTSQNHENMINNGEIHASKQPLNFIGKDNDNQGMKALAPMLKLMLECTKPTLIGNYYFHFFMMSLIYIY